MTILRKITRDDHSQVIQGELLSYRVNLPIAMQRSKATGAQAPQWEVYGKTPHGKYVHVGACWEREIKRGNSTGRTMLSISLTDPEFEGVNFSAFPTDNIDEWEASVERKRKDSAEEKASSEVLS